MPEVRDFPENTQHIHIMGVGGTAMAALAGLLVAKGYTSNRVRWKYSLSSNE